MVKVVLIWMSLGLGFFSSSTSGAENELSFQVCVPSDSLHLESTRPKPRWYRTQSFRALVSPTLLIGYGLSVNGQQGFPFSSKSVYQARQAYFPNFHTQADNVILTLPALAVYGLQIAGIKGEHSPGQQTILLVLSGAMANGVTLALKDFSNELRPDGSSFNSFPSGHTTNAFVAAEFFHQEYKRYSGWYSAAGYSLATATGLLRILNNRHWLSDVLAGAGIGLLSTRLVYLVYPWAYRKVTSHNSGRVGLVPTYGAGCVGVFAVIRLN